MWRAHHDALCAWMEDSTHLVVLELDEQGRVLDCNAGCAMALGRASKPVGCHFSELFSTQPAGSGALPPMGRCLIGTRPPLAPRRLEAWVLATANGRLVLAEARQPDPELLHQLSSLNDEMTNLVRELHREKAALARSLSRVRRLEGLIPICSYCHRIRDESAAWQRLEQYLGEHSDAQFSHGVCPTCLDARFAPEPEEPR